MKLLIIGVALVLLYVFIIKRPRDTMTIQDVKTIDADPPSRESRPMPYPRDTLNTDSPVLMKSIHLSVM